jgi:hypothetical protein
MCNTVTDFGTNTHANSCAHRGADRVPDNSTHKRTDCSYTTANSGPNTSTNTSVHCWDIPIECWLRPLYRRYL